MEVLIYDADKHFEELAEMYKGEIKNVDVADEHASEKTISAEELKGVLETCLQCSPEPITFKVKNHCLYLVSPLYMEGAIKELAQVSVDAYADEH